MRIFYGGAIQGAINREERSHINRSFIEYVASEGYDVIGEHTTGRNRQETAVLVEKALGPLPPSGIERRIAVRQRLIKIIEGDIDAAVFEVSIPSLGTGIEIAHTYLRPRLGLEKIPVLTLYQDGYWPNDLTTMIQGITHEEIPHLTQVRYKDVEDGKIHLKRFLSDLQSK